jgi:hypothetical protein
MKLYELTIEDPNVDEVFAISLVEAPAIESDWVYFNKDEVAFAKVDTEQRIVLGAILIPNKRILRVDGEGQPYEVFFTPKTIKELAQNYLAKKYTDKATLEHNKKIKGVTLVESWVKEGKLDKSNNYGLNLPEGTWVGMMKVTDDKIWNEFVKSGKIKGFSIEGVFEHKLVKASKDELRAEYLLGKIKQIILEAQPSLVSPSYSGEIPNPDEDEDRFISPALLEEGCPEATQSIPVNLKNRQNAVKIAQYGPLNPNEPNEDYWKKKADMFEGNVESAKKALCGNCAFFIQTKKMLDCIASGIGGEVKDEWDTIQAGDLGYCEAFDFKCAASRTCDAWVTGGPITD